MRGHPATRHQSRRYIEHLRGIRGFKFFTEDGEHMVSYLGPEQFQDPPALTTVEMKLRSSEFSTALRGHFSRTHGEFLTGHGLWGVKLVLAEFCRNGTRENPYSPFAPALPQVEEVTP